MGEIMDRMNAYFTKMEAGLKKVDEHLALLGERVRHAPPSPEKKSSPPEAVSAANMNLTLIRVRMRDFLGSQATRRSSSLRFLRLCAAR
jgi:hypothetical protein